MTHDDENDDDTLSFMRNDTRTIDVNDIHDARSIANDIVHEYIDYFTQSMNMLHDARDNDDDAMCERAIRAIMHDSTQFALRFANVAQHAIAHNDDTCNDCENDHS